MKFYQMTAEEVISKLKTNLQVGLEKKEATKRLRKYGQNLLPEKPPTNIFIVLLRQFTSPLMFILLIAAVLSSLIGEVRDAVVISIAVIINVTVGFFQEWKAEKAVYALKKFEVHRCHVRRDGKEIYIEAKKLVPGDIVLIEAGTKVPADIRLTHVIDFQVEEALLTGESKPIRKNIASIKEEVVVGDRFNTAFSGTSVLSGKAEGIVIKTGNETHLGQIAQLITKTKEEATPLQLQIKRLSWFLGAIFLAIIIIILFLGLVKEIPFFQIIMISIALAVAAIPEGLLVGVTVILAIGMQRMLKRHALVRHLIAAETLGSVSVICTDKTGTLTKGHMQVAKIVTPNHILIADDLEKPSEELQSINEINEILTACILNNDAQTQDSKKIIGHPTEIALVQAAKDAGFNIEQIRQIYQRTDEIPFSSAIKYMATIHKFNKHTKLIVKGAPEKIFEMCIQNKIVEKFKELANQMAKEGLRMLAVAQKDREQIDFKKDLVDLNLLGLIGIQDPLRPQAQATVKQLKKAGIRVVLVTGDHKDTAANIATSTGIIPKEKGIVTGTELDKMDEKELIRQIKNIDVFARVDPRHKIRIVDAWQAKGKPVAMIGDGVNDAPALKSADIGVALGSGSDVAHEISDMVLLDNNLSTIDQAVKEGRKIFDNIRKVIVYLMVDSFSEIVLIGGAIFLGFPLPLLASQILWINLITDGFPYMALTVEPAEPAIMKEKPRPKKEPVVNREMKILIFIVGITTDIGLFALFLILLKYNFDLQHIRTIMFTALGIDSLFYAFSVRSMRVSLFKMNPFSNKWLLPAISAGFLIQLSAIYVPPMQKLFSTISLSFLEWLIIIGMSLIKIMAIEITKKYFLLKK